MTQVAEDGVGFKAIEEISCGCDILVFGPSGRNPFKLKYILPDNYSKEISQIHFKVWMILTQNHPAIGAI